MGPVPALAHHRHPKGRPSHRRGHWTGRSKARRSTGLHAQYGPQCNREGRGALEFFKRRLRRKTTGGGPALASVTSCVGIPRGPHRSKMGSFRRPLAHTKNMTKNNSLPLYRVAKCEKCGTCTCTSASRSRTRAPERKKPGGPFGYRRWCRRASQWEAVRGEASSVAWNPYELGLAPQGL